MRLSSSNFSKKQKITFPKSHIYKNSKNVQKDVGVGCLEGGGEARTRPKLKKNNKNMFF